MTGLRELWDQAVQSAEDRRYISGRLGKADSSGTVNLIVSGRPNHLYVSLGPEGDQGVTIAMNSGAPRIPWAPIRLKRETNQLTIVGLDHTPGRLEAFFANQTAPGGVGFHNHRIGSGLEYEIEALRLEPGRVVPTSGMTVGVNAFRYYYNGSWDTWEAGSTLDLTSYKPASGKWCWVLVGVNPSTNALVAVKGTDQDAQADLTVALIDSVGFSDYIPCGAVQVSNADTAVTDIARWHDAHGWLNMAVDELGDLTDVTVSSPAENDSFWYDGSGWVHGRGHRLNMDVAQTGVISSGALNIDSTDKRHGLIDVRGESGADDDLVTISGGNVGDVIALHVASSGSYGDITVKNTGNIAVDTDTMLDDDEDLLVLVYTLAGWLPVSQGHAGLYLVLDGVSGGQTAVGGTASGDDLTLNSTSHATKGTVKLATGTDDVNIGAPDDQVGKLNLKDANGLRMATWSGTGIDGTAQTVIPNNCKRIAGTYLCFTGDGASVSDGGSFYLNNDGDGSSYHETTLLDLGASGVYALRVDDTSGGTTPGKVTVLRKSGTGTTATIFLDFIWDE